MRCKKYHKFLRKFLQSLKFLQRFLQIFAHIFADIYTLQKMQQNFAQQFAKKCDAQKTAKICANIYENKSENNLNFLTLRAYKRLKRTSARLHWWRQTEYIWHAQVYEPPRMLEENWRCSTFRFLVKTPSP